MHTRRIIRLMRLMIELSDREFKAAEEIFIPLGISRSQFYRDKAELEKLGFEFNYNREKNVFFVRQDPGVRVEGLTLSEILSLILAVGRLMETGDFMPAFRAMSGLRKITIDQAGPLKEFIISAVEDAINREEYGCDFELLEKLVAAVNEKRRIHIVYGKSRDKRNRKINIDPKQLVFRAGSLYLEVYSNNTEKRRQRFFKVSNLQDVVITPFLSPWQA